MDFLARPSANARWGSPPPLAEGESSTRRGERLGVGEWFGTRSVVRHTPTQVGDQGVRCAQKKIKPETLPEKAVCTRRKLGVDRLCGACQCEGWRCRYGDCEATALETRQTRSERALELKRNGAPGFLAMFERALLAWLPTTMQGRAQLAQPSVGSPTSPEPAQVSPTPDFP